MKAALLALAVLVAGCATLAPRSGDAERVDQVLAAALELQHATPAAQRRGLAQVRHAFSAGGDDIDRLRLGTLLATLPAPLGDDTQSMALLKPLGSRRPETPITRFAALLAAQVVERQRLEQAGQRGQESLRQSEQQVDELRHKLDELKSIERSVLEREEQLRID